MARTVRPGFDASTWTLEQVARVLFALTSAAGETAGFSARLERLIRSGEVGEQIALLGGLGLYTQPQQLLALAGEGIRSAVQPIYEAVAHRNPYPAEHFTEPMWNQMVVKALFIGSTLAPIQQLDQRRNADLARMLVDYAHERWAAEREVKPELWRCVGPFATQAGGVADLLHVLKSVASRAESGCSGSLGVPGPRSPQRPRDRGRPVARYPRWKTYLGEAHMNANHTNPDGAEPVTYIDPHAHMISRTTDDYEMMARAGVVAVIEPAFWIGQARTNVGSYRDYLSHIPRLRAFQSQPVRYPALLLHRPQFEGGQHEALAEGVMEILPEFATKEGVVAIGEIGFDEQTALEEKYFRLQLDLARELDLPVMIHTPHRDKKRGASRSMDIIIEHKLSPSRVVIDHVNEETVREVTERGFWAAFSIYPHSKMTAERMCTIVREYGAGQLIVDSACDWGISDPLSVPKTAMLTRRAGRASLRRAPHHLWKCTRGVWPERPNERSRLGEARSRPTFAL